MSYQVIARKWRSKTFAELVGQEHITTTLQNALKNDRLPHALLFTGPRGTGKTSSARILAKSLRCTDPQDFSPCNKCAACMDINDGGSVDVIEIDGASNNGVDSVRDLREGVGYMPATGKIKVYIIDEVHMLSTSAFNALLKTLEEPPDHVVFVLATTEIQKIPNTILSRCQRFDFRRIPTRQIADHLGHICKSDGIPYDEESIWMIARQGDGSMRDSQSLLDQVITFCNGQLEHENVIRVLGLTDRGLLNDTTEALIQRDQKRVIDISQQVLNSGFDSKIFVNELLEQFRNLLMVKLGNKSVDLPDTEIEFLANLGGQVGEEEIHFLFDMTLKGASDIQRSTNPTLAFEMLLLRMVSAPSLQQLSNLFSGQLPLASAPAAQNTASAPRPQNAMPPQNTNLQPTRNVSPAASQPSTPGPVTSAPAAPAPEAAVEKWAPEESNWLKIVASIKNLDGKTGATLENLSLVSIDKESMKLALPEKLKFLERQVTQPEFTQKMKDYVAQVTGHPLKISLSISGGGRHARSLQKEEQDNKKKDIEEKVKNHPFVKSTTQMFKGEIREIKERT